MVKDKWIAPVPFYFPQRDTNCVVLGYWRHVIEPRKFKQMGTIVIFQYTREEFKALLKESIKEVLAEEKFNTENQSALINIQEAATLLNLATNTMHEKTSEKLIPHYKQGKKIIFKKSELIAWVESRKVKTIHDIRKEASNHILRFKKWLASIIQRFNLF